MVSRSNLPKDKIASEKRFTRNLMTRLCCHDPLSSLHMKHPEASESSPELHSRVHKPDEAATTVRTCGANSALSNGRGGHEVGKGGGGEGFQPVKEFHMLSLAAERAHGANVRKWNL
eukprot:165033-Hanusia_phi.AAC.3